MHHLPKRFDVSLTVHVHPLDVAHVVTVVFVTTLICGFDFRVFPILILFEDALAYFQHMHIRTPRWLGYFIYRPEQHSDHHSTHDINYGIIPLWDLIFGTFSNPEHEAEKIGLSEDAQSQFWQCLFFKKL